MLQDLEVDDSDEAEHAEKPAERAGRHEVVNVKQELDDAVKAEVDAVDDDSEAYNKSEEPDEFEGFENDGADRSSAAGGSRGTC